MLLVFIEQVVADVSASKTAKELSMMLTEEWAGSARCLIKLQDETFAVSLRVVSSTPDLSEWKPSPFVTLVGDVIHVMSPSGGVGAATAVKDAVALTKVLTELDGISLASINAHKATMRAVAKGNIERSFRGGRLLYGQPLLEQCRAFLPSPTNALPIFDLLRTAN
ncbi:Kynurenine 3-monooxygenase [Madurella mycetomatis]|uniref:Kynurenine 3-monooxygenase n=1 Tax=Madurella mycetomatis TaxID=100816 RepID=A0A175WHA9_9PEZI|nr:Kynurenine 3-monooxygenase [Madurella mycetomatis]